MSGRTLRISLLVVVFLAIISLVIGRRTRDLPKGGPLFTVAAAGPDTSTMAIQGTFAPAVKAIAPSVVNIWSSKVVKMRDDPMAPLLQDPFFRKFFSDQFGGMQIPKERRERSLGSGVIVSNDGYILTNSHVVEGGAEVKVSLPDRTETSARVVGTDPKTDLAVIRVDQRNLTPATLADSSKVEVGDIALAIGNPFGIGQTVTMGVVSAIGRGGLGIEEYEDFIQTDAAINPGNSGGALINTNGQVIAINTAILSGSGGNQGIGFAIPVNMARYVMDQIVRTGKVSRAFLGVAIQPITPDIASAFKLNKVQGALIGDVAKDSPAAKAGLKPGDVVTALDGKPIGESRTLQLAIAQMQPGKIVHLTLLRNGQQQDVTVTLGEQPVERTKPESSSESESLSVLDGVEVTALTPQIAGQLELPADTKGVVLILIAPGSAASEAGLERGDVILEVNRKPVAAVDQFNQYVREAGKQPILLFINRQGRTTYVVISTK